MNRKERIGKCADLSRSYFWCDGAFYNSIIPSVHHLDSGGVVNHAEYIHFAEEARNLMIQSMSSYQDLVKNDLLFMVRKLRAKYIRPTMIDEVLVVETSPKRGDKHIITFEQAFFDLGEHRKATLEVDLILMNSKIGKPVDMDTSVFWAILKEKLDA